MAAAGAGQRHAAELAAAREGLQRTREQMRASPSWRMACDILRPLCLHVGHVRPQPTAKAEPLINSQRAIPGPGAVDSPVMSEAREIRAQITCALSFEHPSERVQHCMPEDLCAASAWCAALKADVVEERKLRVAAWRRAAKLLESWTGRMREWSPDHIKKAKPPRVHVAMVDCAAECFQWPDAWLVEHAVLGCPPVGDIPDSGVFVAHEDPAALSFDDLDHEAWLECVEEKVRRSASRMSPEEQTSLWDRSWKEVSGGWASHVGDQEALRKAFESELADKRCRPMERFGVWQKGKLRPCDNAKASLHNASCALHEKLRLAAADFPVRAAARFVELLGLGDWGMSLGTEDVEAAYRRAMCSMPGLSLVAQWNPRERQVEYFSIQGFNFGLKAAVLWWNRLAVFVGQCAARIGGVMTSPYFDDFPVCEPDFCGQSGRVTLRAIAQTLGLPFSEDKEKSCPLAKRRVFLGVQHDFSEFKGTGIVRCSVTAERIRSIKELIERALRERSFAQPLECSKLCGKLGFALTWIGGKYGRAALQPLYALGDATPAQISPAAVEALQFFSTILSEPQPARTFHTFSQGRRPLIVWSDAMWEPSSDSPAGIGWVVFVPDPQSEPGSRAGRWLYSSACVGESFMHRFVRRKTYIGQLELLAAAAVYYSAAHQPDLAGAFREAPVLHFVDNSGAAAALCKGYARMVDSAMIVHAFWAAAAAFGCSIWIAYVRSKGNIADVPSRLLQRRDEAEEVAFQEELALLTHVLGGAVRSTLVPPVLHWPQAVEAVRSALSAEQASV